MADGKTPKLETRRNILWHLFLSGTSPEGEALPEKINDTSKNK